MYTMSDALFAQVCPSDCSAGSPNTVPSSVLSYATGQRQVHNYSLNEEHVTAVTHDDSDPQDRIMRMHGPPSG